MSRASTIYASAYDTERTHELRIRKGAQRPIRVELNGILPDDVTVSTVSWNTGCQSVARVDSPATGVRSFSAWLVGVNEGKGDIEATATTNDGQVMVFRISAWVQ